MPLDASGSSDGLMDGVQRATKEEEESDSDLEVSIGHAQPSLLAAHAPLCTRYPCVHTHVCMLYVCYILMCVCTVCTVCSLWGSKLSNCPIPTVPVLCTYIHTYIQMLCCAKLKN